MKFVSWMPTCNGYSIASTEDVYFTQKVSLERAYQKIPLNFQIKIFFKISALSLFLLHWPLTSCKVSERTNERSQRYLKTDRRTDGRTDGQGRLLWTPGKPGVPKYLNLSKMKETPSTRKNLIDIVMQPWYDAHTYRCIGLINNLLNSNTWCRYSSVLSRRSFCSF